MPRKYKSINITEEQQQFIRLQNDFEIELFKLAEIESLELRFKTNSPLLFFKH